ncbi:MAG: M61 family metallopeptidase [Planctomycetes bacterium]|nr:M61 family metallopeptidase [Planctomycetota bacterium]MCB9891272.1 M61 family metallopeptidase [Planctomycetota bacterium]MCB9919469.1 M61 family metallopeptidase [Planctomycetota bacterium]
MVVPTTEITVSCARASRHLLEVEVRTPGLLAGAHDFAMPVWTPGSYLVREYSRHVEDVTAQDETGRELPWTKVTKNRWRIELDRDATVVLRYRVYCRDLTVRTNHVDEDRSYWNGAATYIVARDRFDAPIAIYVHPLEGQLVHTSLPHDPDRERAWLARTIDDACDAPFVCSNAPVQRFEALGIEHVCVLDGTPTDESSTKALLDELEKCVQAAAKVFDGKLPYERYHFFVFADRGGSGGLEHADSCVIHLPRSWFRDDKKRLDRIGLFAHEHFHAWNVKRIRPVGLATFDYENENYTPDLWLSEGFTSYYQELVPMLAGLYTREETLNRIAKNLVAVEGIPGRHYLSVAESSFDAWIKLYRQDENTKNQCVSYYDKGACVAFALDVLIQSASGGKRSLDDVMRGLWTDFQERGAGQSRALVLSLVNEHAGRDLTEEFELLIDGRQDAPIDAWIEPFGLTIERPHGDSLATLDIKTKVVDGCLEVASVDRDGVGAALGLSPGDELIAIDGERVRASEWDSSIEGQWRPQQHVELLVARRGILTTLRGALGAKHKGDAKMLERDAVLRWR